MKTTLSTHLGSKIFCTIANHKEGLWAYKLAQLLEEKRGQMPRNSSVIYRKLPELEEEGLVSSKIVKIKGEKRKKRLYKANMTKVTDIIDSHLKEKLNDDEKSKLTEYLESDFLRKLEINGEFNYIDSLVLFLKGIALMSLKIDNFKKNLHNYLLVNQALGISLKQNDLNGQTYIERTRELPNSLLSKLSNLETSFPYMDYIFEGFIDASNDIIKHVKSVMIRLLDPNTQRLLRKRGLIKKLKR